MKQAPRKLSESFRFIHKSIKYKINLLAFAKNILAFASTVPEVSKIQKRSRQNTSTTLDKSMIYKYSATAIALAFVICCFLNIYFALQLILASLWYSTGSMNTNEQFSIEALTSNKCWNLQSDCAGSEFITALNFDRLWCYWIADHLLNLQARSNENNSITSFPSYSMVLVWVRSVPLNVTTFCF